jgi:hypothetical protein
MTPPSARARRARCGGLAYGSVTSEARRGTLTRSVSV